MVMSGFHKPGPGSREATCQDKSVPRESPSPLSLSRVSWRETLLGVTGASPRPGHHCACWRVQAFMCQGATCLDHVSSGEGSVQGLGPSETHPITTV